MPRCQWDSAWALPPRPTSAWRFLTAGPAEGPGVQQGALSPGSRPCPGISHLRVTVTFLTALLARTVITPVVQGETRGPEGELSATPSRPCIA